MKCSICKTENPVDANFCCSCGAGISDPLAVERVRARVQQQIDDLVGERQRELKLDEREALTRIQEAAISRAKTFMFWLGIPVATFLAALSIFGIVSWNDVKSSLKTKLDKVEEIRGQASKKFAEVEQISNAAELALTTATGTRDEAKRVNKEAAKVFAASKLELARLREYEDLGEELKVLIDQAKEVTSEFMNAHYKVSVHVPRNAAGVEFFLRQLRKALGEKGFVVKWEDTLRLDVNQTEILYFDDGDAERARIIKKTLQESGVLETEARKEEVQSRNYEIQIKVSKKDIAPNTVEGV